jgi:hypothetical protein
LHDTTVAVHAKDAAVRTVETATVLVDTRSTGMTMDQIDWGDGGRDTLMAIDCPVHVSPSPSPTPRSAQGTFVHRFRYPGVYYAVVRVKHQCEGPAGSNYRAVRIDVNRGPNLANGPSAPDVRFSPNDYTSKDAFFISGSDQDGWVSRTVVDWGDGSSPAVSSYGLGGCADPDWQWPQSDHGTSLTHHYAKPGTYHVTTQVMSSGCDGKNVQHATAVTDVTR